MTAITVSLKVVQVLDGLGFEPNDAGPMEETPGLLEQGFDFFSAKKTVSVYVETTVATDSTLIYMVESVGGAVRSAQYIPANTDVDLMVIVSLLREAIV